MRKLTVDFQGLVFLIPDISKTLIQEITKEKLRYRNVYARLMPKMLAEFPKRKCVVAFLKEFFERYAQKEKDFLYFIVTGNET